MGRKRGRKGGFGGTYIKNRQMERSGYMGPPVNRLPYNPLLDY